MVAAASCTACCDDRLLQQRRDLATLGVPPTLSFMRLNTGDVDIAAVEAQARAWRAAIGTLGAVRSTADRAALRRIEGAFVGGMTVLRALDEG